MERKRPSQEERAARKDIKQKLNSLSKELVNPATFQKREWARSIFELPESQNEDFFNTIKDSPLSSLFKGLRGFKQKEGSDIPFDFDPVALPFENPKTITLIIDKHNNIYNYLTTEFSISLGYEDSEIGQYSLKASLSNVVSGRYEEHGKVFGPFDRWTLTGAGHFNDPDENDDVSDYRYIPIKVGQLEAFYEVFSQRTVDTKVDAKTYAERMAKLKRDAEEEFRLRYKGQERSDFTEEEKRALREVGLDVK